MAEKEIIAIELNEENIESMVYEIRCQKVLLDFDLARIYGYTTKAFNQQVKNNIEKFPEDFMFQLTNVEVESALRSKKSTANSNLRSQFVTTAKSVTAEAEESSWSKKSTLNKSGI